MNPTSDRIIIKGLVFYGRHGFIPAESELGQKFIVDIELHKSLIAAGRSDDIRETINYAKVYAMVKQVVAGDRCKLIETLAESIAVKILNSFSVDKVKVCVKKPQVSFEDVLDYVGVEIERAREDLAR